MKKILALALLCLGVAGCGTPYKPSSLGGNRLGYSELQISENRWQVRFSCGSGDSIERASDLTLLRAAEICLGEGHTHFLVENQSTLLKYTSTGLPIFTFGAANFKDSGMTMGAVSTSNTVNAAPNDRLCIALFHNPDSPEKYYDAAMIAESLSEKYNINLTEVYANEPGDAKFRITVNPGFAAGDFVFEVEVNGQLAAKLVEAGIATIPLKQGASSVRITNTESLDFGRPHFKPIHFNLIVSPGDHIDVTIAYKNVLINVVGTVTVKQNDKVILNEQFKTIFRLL